MSAPDAPAIVFLGTSLTAGLGLDPEQAYPALIQHKLDAEGLRYRAVNAGVSGETSAGALRRIDWLLQQPVAVLVIETGANDGLRAQDVAATRTNLQGIVDRARGATPQPKLLLLGMQAPPNFGADYARDFGALYRDVAEKNHVPLVPFLLAGVGGVPSLNQGDGIHPTAEGQKVMAEVVWKALRPLI
jgi:acyl-CoA thioesterase-1